MRGVFWLALLMMLGCTSAPVPTVVHTNAPSLPPTAILTATSSSTPTSEPMPQPTPTRLATAGPTLPAGGDIQSELGDPGVLTACLSVVGAPATGLGAQGQLVGYNVSFAAEIAERLGLEMATREPQFDFLIDAVRAHQCDISVSSQNITAIRLELVNFVPYTESIQPVLVATGNPNNINSLIDLCGQAVSAAEGTTHIDLVNGTGDYEGDGLNVDCATAGLPPIDLRTFETDSHAVTALLRGNVVGYLGNSGFQQEFPHQIEFAEAILPPARQGITTALDRPNLHTAVEATLAQMFSDGRYRAILIQHLPNDESVAIVSILE